MRLIIDFNPGFRNYIAHSPRLNLMQAGEMDPEALVCPPCRPGLLAGRSS